MDDAAVDAAATAPQTAPPDFGANPGLTAPTSVYSNFLVPDPRLMQPSGRSRSFLCPQARIYLKPLWVRALFQRQHIVHGLKFIFYLSNLNKWLGCAL
jgi:hypothetical protein